jgi:integrase
MASATNGKASQATQPGPIPFRGPVNMVRFADEIEADYRAGGSVGAPITHVRTALTILVGAGVARTDGITKSVIDRLPAIIEQAKPDVEAGTRAGIFRTVRAICNRGFDLGFLPSKFKFPVSPHDDRAEQVSPLSPGVVQRLLDYLRDRAAAGSFEDRRLHALVETIVWTGLRRKEAILICREHIELDPGRIRIPSREGNLPRAMYRSPVWIPAELSPVLEAWLAWLPADCPFAFPGKLKAGSWKSAGEALEQLHAAALAAGIKERVIFDYLRRFFEEHSRPSLHCLTPWSAPSGPTPPRAGDGTRTLTPTHNLTDQEVTALMAHLKACAADFAGHRLYVVTGLIVLSGLMGFR